jgi:PAS domain S-box-containing protein
MTHQIHDASYQELEKEVADRTRALRESEERFRRLAEASFEGVVISEKGVILDVNELYCDMLGYTRSELLGHSLLAWVAPQLQERVKHYI